MPFNSLTHRRVRRALAVALAAAAVTAPAVTARPVQGPDARDAGTVARQPRDFAEQIRRASHASEVVNAPAVDSVTRPSLPGPPTWPVNPVVFHQLPAAAQTDDTDGVDWTIIGLGIAGSLFAIGGLALLSARRTQRLRVTV